MEGAFLSSLIGTRGGLGRTEVVLGAEGPLGLSVVKELTARSDKVRGVIFETGGAPKGLQESFEVVAVDPSNAPGLAEACKDASTIYLCYEPASGAQRRVWKELTSRVALSAIDTSARVVLASPLLNSESDNQGTESEVLQAHRGGLTRTVVARLPQLIGSGELNPLFRLIYEAVLKGKKAHWVGDLDVPRTMLDVGDAARALVLLGGATWSHGRAWNIAGADPSSGRRFAEFTFRAAGIEPKIGRWGRGIVLTGGILASETKGVLQLPYDYYAPFVLDGGEFAQAFPEFHFTSLEESVAAGYEWYKATKAGPQH